jgi:hypothetical protein
VGVVLGTFAVVSFIVVSILGGGGGAAGSTFSDTGDRVFFSHHIADPSIVKAPRTESVGTSSLFVLLYVTTCPAEAQIEK